MASPDYLIGVESITVEKVIWNADTCYLVRRRFFLGGQQREESKNGAA
jgi:hypothetical protein